MDDDDPLDAAEVRVRQAWAVQDRAVEFARDLTGGRSRERGAAARLRAGLPGSRPYRTGETPPSVGYVGV